MGWVKAWGSTWLTIKHPANVKRGLFITDYSYCHSLLFLRGSEEVSWVPHLALALSNWNPGNRGSIVPCLRISLGLHPFPIGKVLPDPLLSPSGEKSHSSNSFWILWGVWPRAQTSSEGCSFSVRIVSLPDYVATETKQFYALRSNTFLRPQALLTPQSELGQQSIRTIQKHNPLIFSLILENTVFLRLWEGKKLVSY